MQQSGIQFLPGKISTGKYEQRLDQCTKQQLSLLLTSPDYLDWQRQQQITAHPASASTSTARKFSRKAYLGLLPIILLVPALLVAQYLPITQQAYPATSKQQAHDWSDSADIAVASYTHHPEPVDATDRHVDAIDRQTSAIHHPDSTDASQAVNVGGEQQQLLIASGDVEGTGPPGLQSAHLRLANHEAAAVSAELPEEVEGPHPWFGDMQLVYPSATFGVCATVATVVSLVMQWKHQQAIAAIRRRVQRLKFQLIQALHGKEEADGEAQNLQRQLAQMQEVQGQLKSTAEALQGRAELQEQQIEVLRMEMVAKDEAIALQRALSHSSAASEEDKTDVREGVDADANAQGMLTPPQPAPKEHATEAEPEAEMSFTDLIDDSDEDAQGQEAHSLEKALVAEEQILVDPEDLENWADMEREYRAVQAECEDLQSLLVDRDHQLCSLNQDLLDLTHRMKSELGSKDDTVKELRRWLDQAQSQLQNTQAALHEREADCKTLAADLQLALADLTDLKERAASGVQGDEEGVVAGLRQGLRERSTALEASQDQLRLREEEVQDLSHHLQAAQADIASLQAQLGAAEAREGALAREQEAVQGALTGQVAGVMHMMRGLRLSLSSKLTHSNSACQALIQDLAAQNSYADDLEGTDFEHSQGTRQSLSSGPGLSSFSTFTPSSTLALTASGMEVPASDMGSVAGSLALTPVRRMDLAHAGAFELTPEAVTANSATPESLGGSVNGGALTLTPSPLPARLPVLDNSDEQDLARKPEAAVAAEHGDKHGDAIAQSVDAHGEEERENVPPQGTPPSVRKAMAVKHVKDSYMRLGRWNLVAFLKEMGCNPGVDVAPVTQAEFDHVRDNGLRTLHPSNQQDKGEAHKAAAAEARAIVEAWQWPVPKVCLKPNSPYWFAR